MTWNTLDALDLAGKIVLTRVDINVPVDGSRITDTTRIDRIAPTIRDILSAGGLPVLLAHFGRPKGRPVPEMSLRVTLPALEAALGQTVTFVERSSRAALEAMPEGAVVLVENTRFSPMEEANDPKMAQFLASLGDVFCNDAFSAAHRAHASTEGVAHLLPNCAGRLMQAELTALEAALGTPHRPVAAVVGGAKVSTKLELLGNLAGKVDHLVLGGGMANAFLFAQGYEIGNSLAEKDMAGTARAVLEKAGATGCKVHLPKDIVVAGRCAAHAPHHILPVGHCPPEQMILDAGPKTVAALEGIFCTCRTLIWNGPLGAFEWEPFDTATSQAAGVAADLTAQGRLLTVAGGGDTVAALHRAGVADRFSYISTAGGAFLAWMEGKTLPGVAALEQSGK
ncbi:MAG: phosphoglycerate kinase [Rhodobacteraceae bacterium]|nr:phosphoglycerate kinase [Paracoccaceae bacterium]